MIPKLLKLPELTAVMGMGTTSIYAAIKGGLLTPPIKLTSRSSAWPEDEVGAVNAARISGKTEAEIRVLVAELIAARPKILPQYLAQRGGHLSHAAA